jgi:hypothetical protein
MKKTALIIIFSLTTLFANAAIDENSGRAGCKGVYQGKSVSFSGVGKSITDIKRGHGSISVDGRIVADFEGEDMKINYFTQSFKVTNNRGALLEAKVTNIGKGTGVIKRLSIPEFGIEYRNIPMSCWATK